MPIASGMKLTPARLNALQNKVYDAAASADLVLTGSAQDVPGATITFTTVFPGAKAVCTWIADTDATNATAAVGSCFPAVDGTDQPAPMTILEQGTTNDARATIGQQATYTLAAAGSHTIKLRGQRVSGTGADTIKGTHTTLRILVQENVA